MQMQMFNSTFDKKISTFYFKVFDLNRQNIAV